MEVIEGESNFGGFEKELTMLERNGIEKELTMELTMELKKN